MSNARNLARLLPNSSGQLPDANLAAIASNKLSGQIPLSNAPSGSVIRAYTTSSSTGTQINGSSPVDIGLNFTNVVINEGETPLLFMHTSTRLVAGGEQHVAFCVRYTGSASGTIGNPNWGLGIQLSAGSWDVYNFGGINLKETRIGAFNSVGTFNFYLQASSVNPVMIGGEVNNAVASYAAMQATLLIVKE